MDFGALLNYAKQKNDAAPKEEGRYYSTKFAPPKKMAKETSKLSTNIQKFLKKRDEDEAERKRLERQKLNNLLAMRDEKSKNKIRKMLKVTKSANKSVLGDCDDATIAAIDQEDGDGDDYGYTSKESNAFYRNYIEKVKNVHEDKGFAPSRPQTVRDLSSTKERVKAAITREREEAQSHTRQRISHATSTQSRNTDVARSYSTSSSNKTLYDPEAERREKEQKKREEDAKKAKAKRPTQPPMDFHTLLRIAEKKQHEPVSLELPDTKNKSKEPERLMSSREKREHEERQRWKQERAQRERQRELELEAKSKQGERGKGNGTQARPDPMRRIPKLGAAKAVAPAASDAKAKPTSDNLKRPAPAASNGGSSAKYMAGTKPTVNGNVSKRPPVANGGGGGGGGSSKPTATAGSSKSAGNTQTQSRNPYANAIKSGATREFPPREPPAKRPLSAADMQRRKMSQQEAPGRANVPPGRNGGSAGRGGGPAGRGGAQAGRAGGQAANKPYINRIYDDDSEYDSELEDFIDDNDCEEDVSSHIRDIFGYDKRRYRDLDEDDDQMESSFAQMQREEFISKKLGIQEDLEDMRMEAMHKKRKMAKKRPGRIDDD